MLVLSFQVSSQAYPALWLQDSWPLFGSLYIGQRTHFPGLTETYSLFCVMKMENHMCLVESKSRARTRLAATSLDAVPKHVSHIGSADVHERGTLVIFDDHSLNLYLEL